MLFFTTTKGIVVDSRYLESLIAVIECGSIAEAARAEGLTAAAISQRIQALEREIGFELLSRAGHAAKATEACLSLLPRARRIVEEVALLAGDADPRGLTGALRVGAISTALTGVLPATLRALTQHAPGIRLTIVPGTSRMLYQALLAGELDAAILVAPPFDLPKTVHAMSLGKEALVFLSSTKPHQPVTTLLQQVPYIRYDPAAWGGLHAQRFLDDHHLTPTVLCDLDGLEAIAMLVADGVGVSLVPHWSGLERLAGNCSVTPVPGVPYERDILLVTRAQTEKLTMTAAFTQALFNGIEG
jgi:DNA-binding transcriptional LysR family regulator